MYSNASNSNRVFSSVMANGILSPRDRKAKRDNGEAIVTGATTDDVRNRNYDEGNNICVNLFSIDEEGKSNDDYNTFYNPHCGAYLVALENNNAPKLKLPPVEECLRRLGQSREDVEAEVINEFRFQTFLYTLKDKLRKLTGKDYSKIIDENINNLLQKDYSKITDENVNALLQKDYSEIIDKNVNALLQANGYFEKQVINKILTKYIANDSMVKSIFEERLRRTMLVVAFAPHLKKKRGELKEKRRVCLLQSSVWFYCQKIVV